MSRRAVIALSCAACTSTRDIPVDLSGATRAIVVVLESEDRREIHAHEGAALRPIVGAWFERASVIAYDRSFAELGLFVEDGRLVVSTETSSVHWRPLPSPTAWVEIEAGEARDGAKDRFEERFRAIHAARAPCPTLASPRLANQLALRGTGIVSFAARLGDRSVVVGASGSGELGTPPTVSLLRDHVEVPLPGIEAIEHDPEGFAPGDGSVWFTYYAADAPPPAAPRLCRLDPARALEPECAPMQFAQTVTTSVWMPHGLAGRMRDGSVEAVAMNRDRTLWYWREGEPWRPIARSGVAGPTNPCENVGVSSNLLVMDGPGRGIAAFPSAPIRRFDVATSSTTPLLDQEPSTLFCRSAYGRARGGEELLVVLDRTTGLAEPRPRIFWRAAADEAWRQHFSDLGLGARTIAASDDRLLANGLGDLVHPVTFDDLGPRVCPGALIANSLYEILPLDDETWYFFPSVRDALVAAWIER